MNETSEKKREPLPLNHSFLRLSDVATITAMGASTILAWEKAGKFPQAVRLSAGKRVWYSGHVSNWILERAGVASEA
jgi:predicted DNA-binding transcriptional regulator AlpA